VTERNARGLAIAAVVAAVLLAVAFFVWPWFAYPSSWSESVLVTQPPCGNSTGPWPPVSAGNFSFHGVEFRFWWSVYICGFSNTLNVTGTESDGTAYSSSFTSGGPPREPIDWTSPDGRFAVYWNETLTLRLTVNG